MRKKGQRKKARKGIGCGKIGRQAEIEEEGCLSKLARAAAKIRGSIYIHYTVWQLPGTGGREEKGDIVYWV